MTDSEKLDLLLEQFGVMRSDITGLKTDVSVLKTDVADLKTDVADLKIDVTGIKMHLENETDRYIRILAENHGELVKKLNRNNEVTETDKFYQMKVDYLEKEFGKLKNDVTILQLAHGVC